jgi:hypothetical protein
MTAPEITMAIGLGKTSESQRQSGGCSDYPNVELPAVLVIAGLLFAFGAPFGRRPAALSEDVATVAGSWEG